MAGNRIQKLREDVIAKIAAGEVIVRPVNCVKELVENSLDAGALRITITIKGGGYDLIMVKDDGHGIRREDLEMVCEKHATSKLSGIEDLSSMETYGFRGEALSSMSVVSHVTIITKTENDNCGHKVEYINGAVNGGISTIAALVGTTVKITDLFYNLPFRRKMERQSRNVEYSLICDLITKLACHYSNKVSFTLNREDKDVHIYTTPKQTIENIKILFGQDIGKDVVPICSQRALDLKYSMSGVISKPTVSVKRMNFLLFINDRLVECQSLKKAIETVYEDFLKKGSHPFVYLSLKIDPKDLDVNIHPSKNEVKYLHENEINEDICECIKLKLSSNQEISYKFTRLKEVANLKAENSPKSLVNKERSVRQCDLVRHDPSMRTLDEVISQHNIRAKIGKNSEHRHLNLLSLKRLNAECDKEKSQDLKKLFEDSSFVGCVTESLFTIANGNKLILANLNMISNEVMYQAFLKDFGNFGIFELSEPLPIEELMEVHIEATGTPSDPIAAKRLLVSKREMLDDYFSLTIDEEGILITLPLIIDGHKPNIYHLPQLIYDLVNEVDWTTEQECFKTIGLALASFYSILPGLENDDPAFCDWKKVVEYVIFPRVKRNFKPSKKLENALKFVTSMSDLYKTFERC